MNWRAVAAGDIKRDVILFDGDCVLCSHWAAFVHRRDADMRFAFVALQSPAGRALARRLGVDADAPQTNIVIIDGVATFKSDAALAILAVLPGYRWAHVLAVAPKPMRDWAYDRIARNSYRWFGRREACALADPAMRARIIESATALERA